MSLVQRNNVVVVLIITMMLMKMMMCDGAVYKVGGFAGWTSIGNVDYEIWAASNNFQPGDTVIFEYNAEYHNVMRVSYKMFKTCNVSEGTPLETFNTGNDSININNYGHHLFISGFPGHCQNGLKVDINVIRVSATNPRKDKDDEDDEQCHRRLPCSNNNKASHFMPSFALIGLAISSFLALAAF